MARLLLNSCNDFMIVTSRCLLNFLLRRREWLKAYRISLASTVLLLALVTYAGSELSRSRGLLTRYTPEPLRTWMGLNRLSPLQQPVFEGIIKPILEEHCVSCHGTQKHKADLR